MEEEIIKLREVIDSLREKACDPEMEKYLLEWLRDPGLDSTGVEKLLNLRYSISRLNQESKVLGYIASGADPDDEEDDQVLH